jgi:Calcineurin-like phosphoesterase
VTGISSTRRGARVGRTGALAAVLLLVVALAGCLMRAPYMTDALPTTEVLNFATHDGTPAPAVTFGPSPGCNASTVTASLTGNITVGSQTEYQWNARLTGLSAKTSYCYDVTQGGTDQLNGARPSFTTPLASGDTTPYSFAVLGDWGGGTQDETNVLSHIRSSGAQFVMTVGDNVYNDGTQTDYGDIGQGNVFTLANWPGGQSAPWFPAQGNHGFTQNLPYLQNFPESGAAFTSAGRYQQDAYCCLGVMPSSHTYASAWYAFDWGNARFYVLEAAWSDSNGGYQGDFQAHWNGTVAGCSICGAELQWLKNDLAAHTGTAMKFAFFHYPLHVDNTAQPSDTFLDGPNGLEGVLANNGVKIVFNGHAHVYERNTPQIAGTPMVSYVTGGGGAELGKISTCSSFDAYAIGSGSSACHAPAPTSDAQVFHFLKVSVNGRQVTVTPTDENGRTFDVQTYGF